MAELRENRCRIQSTITVLSSVCAIVLGASKYDDWHYENKREELELRYGLEHYQEYICDNDCEAFRKGAEWGDEHELNDGNDCPRDRVVAFYQGCLASVVYYVDVLNQHPDVANNPISQPAPWDEQFMKNRKTRRNAEIEKILSRWVN